MKHLLVIATALLMGCSTSKNPNSVVDTTPPDTSHIGIDGSICIDQAAAITAVGQDAAACTALPGQSTELGADAGNCDQRTTHDCTADCVGSTLDSQLHDLVRLCGGLPLESRIGIVFSNGCAVRIVADITGPNPTTLTDCLVRHLDVTHYACADAIPCWTTEYSLITAN